MEKRRQWVLLALIIVTIPTALFLWSSIHWNLWVLSDFSDRGRAATGVVTSITQDSSTRQRSKTITIEHRPEGASEPYRNWLRSGYVNRLTHDPAASGSHFVPLAPRHRETTPLEVRDRLSVVYLPEQSSGRAVMAEDFEARHQAPIERWYFALALVVAWLALAVLFIRTRNSSR